jgi:hypothetical protein
MCVRGLLHPCCPGTYRGEMCLATLALGNSWECVSNSCVWSGVAGNSCVILFLAILFTSNPTGSQ